MESGKRAKAGPSTTLGGDGVDAKQEGFLKEVKEKETPSEVDVVIHDDEEDDDDDGNGVVPVPAFVPGPLLSLKEQIEKDKGLNAWKHETLKIECDKEHRNDILEYLHSFDADMVMELSQPSSIEVEDIIHQLVSNILRRFFKEDPI